MVRRHRLREAALGVLYSDVERHALDQLEAFLGTPGAVIERRNAAGFRFYAHRFYDHERRPRERYIAGPVGDAGADAAAEDLRLRILEMKGCVPSLRMFGREKYALVDARTYAAVAALHNRGVFRRGGVLIGSLGLSSMLDRMSVRAPAIDTTSIEIARAAPLTLDEPIVVRDVLSQARLSGVRVKLFARRTARVPELGTDATGLPLVDYLLGELQDGMVMTREGCCAVRIPVPERFVIHQLVVTRGTRSQLEQVAFLAAVVAQVFPQALEGAIEALPRGARRRFRGNVRALEPMLAKEAPRAWEELSS